MVAFLRMNVGWAVPTHCALQHAHRKFWWVQPTLLLLAVCIASPAAAQSYGGIGGAYTPPPTTAVPGTTAAAPATAPAGSTGLIATIEAHCAAKKARICGSPLGQFMYGAFQPLNAMTGGMTCVPCSQYYKAQVAALAAAAPGSQPAAVSAAAKIQQEEAQAKARREAVRYLGTVDCHYFPEAEVALIASLRADRNECVRWEAAKSLGRGCCCSKATIEALTLCVQGSQKDGNPCETSHRVRAQAFASLQLCLALCHNGAPMREGPLRPEYPVEQDAHGPQSNGQLPTIATVAHYANETGTPAAHVLLEAQRTVERIGQSPEKPPMATTGNRNLWTLWEQAGE